MNKKTSETSKKGVKRSRDDSFIKYYLESNEDDGDDVNETLKKGVNDNRTISYNFVKIDISKVPSYIS